jgi:hypothetical protein
MDENMVLKKIAVAVAKIVRANGGIFGPSVAAGQPIPGLTAGSVLFAGVGGILTQDNINLFFNNTTKALTVGGQGLFADGTAALPGMSYVNELNTGIRRRIAGVISFSTLGNNTVEIIDLSYGASAGVRMNSAANLMWCVGDSNTAQDVNLLREAANTLALRNSVNAQTLVLGQGNAALAAGRLQMGRDAAAGFAPGAGRGMLRFEAGTNPGTLRLVVYAGTSAVGVLLVDNIGAGN